MPRDAMADTGMIDSLGLGRLGTYRRFLSLRRKESTRAEPATARVVCIGSGKGGTGKSIVSTNLATLRARAGERVLLVDFDAGLANAHLLLGLAPRHDLSHVLEGEVSAEDALVEGPYGLKLLSGGVGRQFLSSPTRRELDRLFRALRPLEGQFDLVLIDHGAGLTYAMTAQLAAASTLLLVTNHEVTALSDSYALYKRASHLNPYLRVGFVVNRSPDADRAASAWERFKSASDRFLGHSPDFVGWIPADPAVGASVEARQPVSLLAPEAPASQAIARIAGWGPLEFAKSAQPFFDRARAALR